MVRPKQWVQARILVGEIPMLLETIAVWQIEEIKNSYYCCIKIALISKMEVNRMLDIISIATLLLLLIGIPMILIIIGGSNKTEKEQELENE